MNEPLIATIMAQAQVFASSWSIVGSRFEAENQLEQAEGEKKELRRMVLELIAERDALRGWKELAKQYRAELDALKSQNPVAWYYTTNDAWDCYSKEAPPDDAYDANSLTPLYARPAPPAPDFTARGSDAVD